MTFKSQEIENCFLNISQSFSSRDILKRAKLRNFLEQCEMLSDDGCESSKQILNIIIRFSKIIDTCF